MNDDNHLLEQIRDSLVALRGEVIELRVSMKALDDHEIRIRLLEKSFYKALGFIMAASFVVQIVVKLLQK